MATTVQRERKRCAQLVRQYRDQLLRALHGRPGANNARQVETVIKRLEEIESDIRMVNISPGVRVVDGFSMEELSLAESLISDLSENPFE